MRGSGRAGFFYVFVLRQKRIYIIYSLLSCLLYSITSSDCVSFRGPVRLISFYSLALCTLNFIYLYPQRGSLGNTFTTLSPNVFGKNCAVVHEGVWPMLVIIAREFKVVEKRLSWQGKRTLRSLR